MVVRVKLLVRQGLVSRGKSLLLTVHIPPVQYSVRTSQCTLSQTNPRLIFDESTDFKLG